MDRLRARQRVIILTMIGCYLRGGTRHTPESQFPLLPVFKQVYSGLFPHYPQFPAMSSSCISCPFISSRHHLVKPWGR
ncbi:unnamed protein product [Nezara viridula]|uniref:Uncharacterized protein n=1 Tax=Nezara viridula TaxID=85310 RepID=A0A9P0HRZ7_NEZVI|nr:unnamed protein product [Nezara viridula]